MGDIRMLEGMRHAKAEPYYDTICERCLTGPPQKSTKPKNFNCQSCKKPIPPPKPPHLCGLQTTVTLKSILDKLKLYEEQEKKRATEVSGFRQPALEDQDHIGMKDVPLNPYGPSNSENDKYLGFRKPILENLDDIETKDVPLNPYGSNTKHEIRLGFRQHVLEDQENMKEKDAAPNPRGSISMHGKQQLGFRKPVLENQDDMGIQKVPLKPNKSNTKNDEQYWDLWDSDTTNDKQHWNLRHPGITYDKQHLDLLCSEMTSEIDGFCSDCGLLTCGHCAIDGHEGCSKLLTIGEAIAFQKQNMSEAGKEKRREMSHFGLKTQFSVGLIKNEIEHFTRQAERAKKEIHLKAQKLLRQIHEEECKFLNQVDKCYKEEIINLEALKEIFDNFHQCGEVFMPVVLKQQDVTMEYLVKVDLFSRTMFQYNKVTEPQIPSIEFQSCKPQHINLGVLTIYHDPFDELSNVLD